MENFPARNGRLDQKGEEAARFGRDGARVGGQRRALRMLDGRLVTRAEKDGNGREAHQRSVACVFSCALVGGRRCDPWFAAVN